MATTLDLLVLLARSFSHFVGATAFAGPDRLEAVVRNHTLGYCKDADDAAAGDATAERPIFVVPAHMADGVEILAVTYTPNATVITGADATAPTVTFSKRDGAGGGATVVATKVYNAAGGNTVAFRESTITLSATLANRQLAAGGVLTFLISKAGAGQIVGAGVFKVVYKEL